MKLIIAVNLFIFANMAYAGGDYALGKVSGFEESNGTYSFHFEQTDEKRELMEGCKELDVILKYEDPFDYYWLVSWLPGSVHPSEGETNNAIAFLKYASKNDKILKFGYEGHRGLAPTENICEFKSSGLSFKENDEYTYVTSFN